MSQSGVSILLRAGNNKEAAKKFLDQFIKVNTYQPVEVIVLFNEPEQKHLQLMTDYAGKIRLKIFPAKGRLFPKVDPQVSHENIFIASTPLILTDDILPNAIKSLEAQKSNIKYAKPIEKTLLTKKSVIANWENNFLNAPLTTLEKVATEGSRTKEKPKQEAEKPNIQQGAAKNQSPNKPSGSGNEAKSKVANQAAKTPSKPATTPAAKPVVSKNIEADNAALDKKIKTLEEELVALDTELAQQYQEIDKLDKQYDEIFSQDNAEKAMQLKDTLKEKVYKANERLKTLKSQHDELERLRIRRFSITN
ncbi:hypothetical protein ACU6TU_12055 [Halomonas sp. LS-001]